MDPIDPAKKATRVSLIKRRRRLISSVFLMLCLIQVSCKQKPLQGGEMVVYSPSEIKTLFDNALKVDTIGKPIVQITKRVDDSTHETITSTISSQYYMIYIARDRDNHLIPKAQVQPSQVSAMIRSGGGIGVLTSCGFACRPTGVTICPDASGCLSDGCGCTPPNCGAGCTITQPCTGIFSGFGFGQRVIF
jgi:hypothetical protein